MCLVSLNINWNSYWKHEDTVTAVSHAVSDQSVMNDKPHSCIGNGWWVVVVYNCSFLVERAEQLWTLLVALPLPFPCFCLTKELKDLGLSEPLSRAWIWAADQQTNACAFCILLWFKAALIWRHLLNKLHLQVEKKNNNLSICQKEWLHQAIPEGMNMSRLLCDSSRWVSPYSSSSYMFAG